MDFNERLKKLRLDKDVSQRVVAEFLGVTKQAYSLYELGKRDPDNQTLYALCDYFDVSLDYLLGRSEIKKIPTKYDGEELAKVALFGGAGYVTDEMWDEVKNYVEFIKQRNNKNDKQ